MSGDDKSVELVRQLIQATGAGRVAWHPTARVDEFVSSFAGRYSILVTKEGGDCFLRMLDEDGRELLQISDEDEAFKRPIATRSGVIDTVEPPARPVSLLFDLARRGGLRVNIAIDEVLQGLKRA
jgi:hypothetical protein